ncbi:hypothetical protein RJT34_20432 [Clitoria ternatea]|uniref:Pyridoxamine kinase/Phosphomethylpyrimidine kinase domain-containing protein n=1 Tax=Clitoria ternatea TaxID=43366 RepID=A0AAN9ITJ1_CLITE
MLPNTFIVPLSSPLLLHKTLLEFRVSTFYTSIFVAQQLNSVLSDMHVDVVKTGMLPSLGIVKVLCQNLRKFLVKALVVDPVMISTSGDELAGSSVLVRFCPEEEENLQFHKRFKASPNASGLSLKNIMLQSNSSIR